MQGSFGQRMMVHERSLASAGSILIDHRLICRQPCEKDRAKHGLFIYRLKAVKFFFPSTERGGEVERPTTKI
jgi:hypothetical protein